MRSLKKVCAVAAAAVMTMSMSVAAFAATTITFHYQNTENWENVGAWVYEGISWDTNVTTDAYLKCDKHDEVKPLWPGAKCVDEGNGWVKYTATFSDEFAKNGCVMKFNNFVADSKLNDTTEQCDLDVMAASDVPTTATAEKKETSPVVINKKNAIIASGTIPSDVYVCLNADSGKVEAFAEAPASYPAASNGGSDNSGSGSDNSGSAAGSGSSASGSTGSSAAGSASGSTGSTSTAKGSTTSNSSVKTGDTVAVSVVALGALAAVAFVASRKKVNA